MGKSTPSGSTTVTQNSTPWTGQQSFLTGGTDKQGQTVPGIFPTAASWYQSAPWTSYPGQTISPVQPQTYQALQLQQDRALSGSPVTNAAQNESTNTLNGSYLSAGNPYFGNMVNQMAQALEPQVMSGMEAGGRYGSGAAENAFASALTNEAGQLGYQNYQNERGLQNQALYSAPSLANQDYTDIGQLANVGSTLQGIGQGYVNEDINRFNQNQQLPLQQLQGYAGLIGQPQLANSSTSTPYFTNPIGSALGTGLGALGLYNGLSGTGALAGLGGLLGKGGAGAAAAGTASSLGSLLPMGLAL